MRDVTYPPDHPLLSPPVCHWLMAHGERRYIALDSVRVRGPLAFYTVYAGSRFGQPETVRIRAMQGVTRRTVRWVGRSMPTFEW